MKKLLTIISLQMIYFATLGQINITFTVNDTKDSNSVMGTNISENINKVTGEGKILISNNSTATIMVILSKKVANFEEDTIKNIKYIMCEVWEDKMYENSAVKKDIDIFLKSENFDLIDFRLHDEHFGNALYKQKKQV